MKAIITLVLSLTLCSAMSQERMANAMLIPNFKSDGITQIQRILDNEQYEIDRINNIKGYFRTNPRRVNDCPGYIVGLKIEIEGFVTDEGLYVYALYRYSARSNTGCTTAYSGIARKAFYRRAGCRVAFNELERVVELMSDDYIYLK